MPLRPITLGTDQLLTMGNGPWANNDTFNSLNGACLIAMSGGVSILVFPGANPVTPFQTGHFARAFTVNPDGTQNWGNVVQVHTVNTAAIGCAVDATRAFIMYSTSGLADEARILTLGPDLTLTMGSPASSILVSNAGAGLTTHNLGSVVAMNANTVIVGLRGAGASRNVVRCQRLDISGTAISSDYTRAFNFHDFPAFLTGGGIPQLCRVDALTCGFFWPDIAGTGASYWAMAQLSGDTMTDVSFGPNVLYDGVTYQMTIFREIQLGFVLAQGEHVITGPNQAVAQILEFDSGAHTLTKGPILDLTETAPAATTSGGVSSINLMAGHQGVFAFTGLAANVFRYVEVNLGTFAREVQEVGFAELTAVSPSPTDFGVAVTLSPRRVLFTYTTSGAGSNIEHAVTLGLPVVPSLRWRQRDDCLTPGSATPCICFNLTPGVVCIPPWNFWLTTSVQYGGRVGPRNTYY